MPTRGFHATASRGSANKDALLRDARVTALVEDAEGAGEKIKRWSTEEEWARLGRNHWPSTSANVEGAHRHKHAHRPMLPRIDAPSSIPIASMRSSLHSSTSSAATASWKRPLGCFSSAMSSTRRGMICA